MFGSFVFRSPRFTLLTLALAAPLSPPSALSAEPLSPLEQLGKTLFFDALLSVNGTQSCAFCHDPDQGFGSPDDFANMGGGNMGGGNMGGGVVRGAIEGRFGNRKPPSAAYAANAPIFHHEIEGGDVLFVGGAFLDGRATGYQYGSPGADQAHQPFTNPVEMAMPHLACVVQQVCAATPADYPTSLADVWGADICDIAFPPDLAAQCTDADANITLEFPETIARVDRAIAGISRALNAYELSSEVNRFSSRYDRYLAGDAKLTIQEFTGLKLFENEGRCSQCHSTDAGPNGEPALLTNFTYDNLGVPANPQNPWYQQEAFNPDGLGWIDQGLGGFLANDPVYAPYAGAQIGKQKVPTLRNVDARTAPGAPKSYMHNGYFKTLEGIVRFYNTRDVWPRCAPEFTTEAQAMKNRCWPAPEVAQNVNTDELGNLKLSDADEAALVAYLKTLTDQ